MTSHGESQPVAPNQDADGSENPQGRQQNRRVEIVVEKEGAVTFSRRRPGSSLVLLAAATLWLASAPHASAADAAAPPAVSEQTDPSPQAAPPARFEQEPIVPAEPESATCEGARSRLPQLLAELAADVPADQRREGEAFVAKNLASAAPGRAWNELGLGLMMLGDHPAAAWAGLTALRHDWTPIHLTNTGVYLLRLQRATEARWFLNCAYDMEYRSPYLLEALAAAHDRRGQQSEARRFIMQAREAAPRDTAIAVEAALLTTGRPPRREDEPPPTDAVDRCIRELQGHADNVLAGLQTTAAMMKRIKSPNAEQYAAVTEHFPKILSAMLQQLGGMRDRARFTRERFRQFLAGLGQGEWYTDTGYRAFLETNWNLALSACIHDYIVVTEQLLKAAVDDGAELPFWAEVVGRSPNAFARELRARELAIDPSRSRPPDYYHIYRLLPYERSALFNPGKILNLARVPWITYGDARLQADLAYDKAIDDIGVTRTAAELAAKLARAKRKWCDAVKPAYLAWTAEVEGRYSRIGQRFDKVASRLVWWTALQIMDARQFARKYVKAMRWDAMTSAMGDQADVQRRMVVESVNRVYRILLGFLEAKHAYTTSIPTFLNAQGAEFTKESKNQREGLEAEANRIREHCTPTTVMEQLAQLTKEELEALMRDLNERMLMEDVTAETEFKPHCDFGFGTFSASVDYMGKVTRGFENIKISTRGKEVVGVSIETGAGVSGSLDGVAAKGDITLLANIDPRTGEWDALVEAEGKIGVGVIAEVPSGGGNTRVGAACYPGSATVTLNAREFSRHDILFEQVRAVHRAAQ